MSRETVILGGRTFPSKSRAERFLRDIKERHRPGEFLSDDDAAVVLDALQRHPACSEKVGFKVRRVGLYSNGEARAGYGFGVERVDGSVARFSYHVCFAAQRRPHSDRVLEALRNAVRPYIFRWRDRMFAKHGGLIACPVTGRPVQEHGCHVDHVTPTFSELASSFLAKQYLDMEAVSVAVTHGEQVEAVLSDPYLASRWIRFHNLNCKLQVISVEGHRLQHGAQDKDQAGSPEGIRGGE